MERSCFALLGWLDARHRYQFRQLHPRATMPPVVLYRGLWSLPKLEIVKRDRAISLGPTKWRARCVRPGTRPDEFAVAQRYRRAGTVGPADISPDHRTHLGREGFANPLSPLDFRREAPRHLDHDRVVIEPHRPSGWTNHRRDQSRNNARAAGCIEDILAPLGPRALE